MKELTISQNDAGQRLDRFLAKAVPLLPASPVLFPLPAAGWAGAWASFPLPEPLRPAPEPFPESEPPLPLPPPPPEPLLRPELSPVCRRQLAQQYDQNPASVR